MHIRSFMFLSTVAFLYTGHIAQATALPTVVCQNKKCYPAEVSLSRESLFDRVQNLINENINKDILICEANPQSKMCLTRGFSLPLNSSSVSTKIDFLSAKITSNKHIENSTGTDLIIDYKTKSDKVFPYCQTAFSRLGVLDRNSMQLVAPDFTCSFGNTNQTILSLTYHIDYINFDNGSVGAYYSIAAGQKLRGQSHGYVLFRFAQPSSINLKEPFPMPDVLQNYQIVQQNDQVKIAPVWMKPTPILNIETPQVTTKEDGSLVIQNQPTPAVPTTQNVPSTTGLITQEKNILPPTQGLRKTVTVKKQIFQKGKPVVYEEDVRHYIQENENAPLIEEKQELLPTEEKQPEIPQMPTPVNHLPMNKVTPQIPSYIFPHEVTLSPEEIEQIQKELPPETSVQAQINQGLPLIETEETSRSSNFWNKIEKLFYF